MILFFGKLDTVETIQIVRRQKSKLVGIEASKLDQPPHHCSKGNMLLIIVAYNNRIK